MKRSLAILLAGLFVAVAAYCARYLGGTAAHERLLESETPELLWLKKEFNVTDAEFERISALHVAYLPHCKEMCRRIDQQNERIRILLAATNAMTPEIDEALAENAKLRIECQRSMLEHFFRVSQTMPAEQGKRYLAWVQEKTFLPRYGMNASR